MSIISVITPVIESDVNKLLNLIDDIISAFECSKFSDFLWFVIIQHKSPISADVLERFERRGISLLFSSYYSVSQARNVGINASRKIKSDVLYFLDCDAVPSIVLLNLFHDSVSNENPIVSGKICWTTDMALSIRSAQMKIKSVTPIKLPTELSLFNTFLGCYGFDFFCFFNTGIKFDESIGPAEDTVLKTGEDVLLIADFVQRCHYTRLVYASNARVYHPAREMDSLKVLEYSAGQAVTYKKILKGQEYSNNLKLVSLFYLILFLSNSFLKVILFKANAIKILKVRIKALFSRLV